MPIKVLTVLGTRPEAVKLAPVVKRLESDQRFVSRVCFTSQHDHLLKQITRTFAIEPHYDLRLMTENQSLHQLTSRVLLGTRTVIEQEQPNIVMVQGDTTTAFATCLSAFYLGVPVGHVEAGLRTGDLCAPYPEEANRVLLSRLAAIHFCPTKQSRANLLREEVDESRIVLTGNTVIDALKMVVARIGEAGPELWSEHFAAALPAIADRGRKLILVTGHRREHFGQGFRSICEGIRRIAESLPEASVVYPVHLNPNVRRPVMEALSNVTNVHLIEPLPYEPFVYLMNRAYIILTDSGGVQEEAPALGKPVLVMRDSTERPEAVAAGVAILVGADAARLEGECVRLFTDGRAYHRMAQASELFGDGRASERIAEALYQLLDANARSHPSPMLPSHRHDALEANPQSLRPV